MKYEKWSEEKISLKSSLCKTKQEMKKRFPKEYSAAKRMGLLNSSIFSHMPKRTKKEINSKWGNKKDVLLEASKYPNRKAFFKGSQGCYNAAKRRGWFEEACARMPENLCIGNKPPTYKWTKEVVTKEALRYNKKSDFAFGSAGAYDAAVKNGWIDDVCSHMEVFCRTDYSLEVFMEIFSSCKTKKEAREKDINAYVAVFNRKLEDIVFGHTIPLKAPKYTKEQRREEAFKHKTRTKFAKSEPSMYMASIVAGDLNEICGHMGWDHKIWENEELRQIALQYPNMKSLRENNNKVYNAIYLRGLQEAYFSHMPKPGGVSYKQLELRDRIREVFSSAKSFKDMKVNIFNKPHICGFEIDIFVPELNRGIEFDGDWSHSFDGLKWARPNWPDEDLINYHILKDNWFLGKNISILHITESDWDTNKEVCVRRCVEFLSEK